MGESGVRGMSVRQPDFDLDRAIGEQSELWVSNLREALRGSGRVEIKAPKPFLREQTFYVEYACKGRDGTWRKSGINTSKADLWLVTFGCLPGGLALCRHWLKRAAKRAYDRPFARKECLRGSNPTKAVVVSLGDLWLTRDGEP